MFRRRRAPETVDRDTAYRLWAPAYPPRAHNALMRAEQAAIEPMLSALAFASALDLGTGSGRYLPVLARAGARLVVGLDVSWAMLTAWPRDRPRVRGDALALPFRPATFDLVLASLMVGDVADLDRWAGEVRRVLRPGGHLLYSDFHPSWADACWQRVLTTQDSRLVAVPYFARPVARHLDTLRRAGFEIADRREPRLVEEPDPSVAAFRRRSGDPPVALVVLAAARER